jgi:hypothetical protein
VTEALPSPSRAEDWGTLLFVPQAVGAVEASVDLVSTEGWKWWKG